MFNQVWARPFSHYKVAVILFNRSTIRGPITAHWEDIGIPPKSIAIVRDLWEHKTLKTVCGEHYSNGGSSCLQNVSEARSLERDTVENDLTLLVLRLNVQSSKISQDCLSACCFLLIVYGNLTKEINLQVQVRWIVASHFQQGNRYPKMTMK